MIRSASLCKASPGFGLGLRTPHYPDFQRQRQPLDWLEIITDNFLVEGGRPLLMLEAMRRDYPLAMHGVAMSIGSADGLDLAYLQKVKGLAQRIEPLWVSDHLCWSGLGKTMLHDLNPLPYTEEAARRVIAHIKQAQDILQRRLVIENVSSYVDFTHSGATEWEFLHHVATQADCLLLVDVNNIYVSSVNHGFDPQLYLDALPRDRVQQIHLAGHSRHPTHIIDTHDHPVCEEVWALYAAACRRLGSVATMIERDDHIPPLPELLAEMAIARAIAKENVGLAAVEKSTSPEGIRQPTQLPDRSLASAPAEIGLSAVVSAGASAVVNACASPPGLLQMQTDWLAYVLTDPPDANAPARLGLNAVSGSGLGLDSDSSQGAADSPADRLGIYHRAYRLRLCEVLSESFEKTSSYMGSVLFDQEASQFVVQQPPAERNLGRYGSNLPAFLAQRYPDNPELAELAQLDWDLRTRFDGANHPALCAADLAPQANGHLAFIDMPQPLHPSVVLRDSRTNAVKLWRAIDDDVDVPEVAYLPKEDEANGPPGLMVWRWNLQPHFMRLDPAQYRFMQSLAEGWSINQSSECWADTDVLPTPEVLGAWLKDWLAQGILRLG